MAGLVVPVARLKHGAGVANDSSVDRAQAQDTTHGFRLVARALGGHYGRLKWRRLDWLGFAHFTGQISGRNRKSGWACNYASLYSNLYMTKVYSRWRECARWLVARCAAYVPVRANS